MDLFYESWITFDCVFGQRTSWRNSFDQVVGVVIRTTREKWKIQFETEDKSNLSLCFNRRVTIICLLLRQTWRNKYWEGKHICNVYVYVYVYVNAYVCKYIYHLRSRTLPYRSDFRSWDWSLVCFKSSCLSKRFSFSISKGTCRIENLYFGSSCLLVVN